MTRALFVISTLALCAVSGIAVGADPSLSAISPYGLQRGREIEVQFSGARLGDAKQLLLYKQGVEVKSIEKVDDKRIKTKLAVAEDCPIGIHAVRVFTASGISNLKTFCVGRLPESQEKEPNNDFDAPQQIEKNLTISGVIQSEDVDYFVVKAKKGERIVAELEGLRLGNTTFFDPYLAILNEDRFELARSDDVALLRQDPFCSVIAPEDGNYVIEVRESAYGGNGNCKYRMHVGQFPRPTAVFPAGGQPGEELAVIWLGDPAGTWEQTVRLPETSESEFDLFAHDEHGFAPSANRIRVVDIPNTIELEPNDSLKQPTPASAPGAMNGIIEKPGDNDYFKFTAKKNQQFDIRVYARKIIRSPLDPVLYVYRASNGSRVTSNDDSGGPDSYARFKAPADDDYVVRVYDHLRDGGPDFVYRVEITEIKRRLTLNLREKSRYVPPTLPVPRGNRAAVIVTASRSNFGGELGLSLDGMPAGMTVTPLNMPANRNEIPLLLSAAADAPVAGTLADLMGRTTDEKVGVVGHLNQRTMLVRGRNNRDMWGHNADRMAVGVTDEVPFDVEISQPQVPLVRSGTMSLKVVAKRRNDYKGSIRLDMLYNPPGVSYRSATIPEGKNEVTMTLTANSKASIAAWPIILRARATVGNGQIEVATKPATLEVSDTFFSFAFEKAAGEQGQQTELLVRVENNIEFDGEATVQLLGLPANTATSKEPLKMTKDTTELVFPITISEKAKPNRYKSLICRAVVTQHGETITHNLGRGELRVDKPLPPKANQPAVKKVVKKAPQKKRLSRLEQLRLEREQQATAGGAGGGGGEE